MDNSLKRSPSLTSIVLGSIVVEAVMAILLVRIQPGPSLKAWYGELGFSALTMDVVSLAVGTWLGMKLASRFDMGHSFLAQMAGVVVVQVVHDVVFGTFVLPHLPESTPVKLFRTYAAEKGTRILVDDALLMMAAVVGTHVLQRLKKEEASVIALTSMYVSCLLLL